MPTKVQYHQNHAVISAKSIELVHPQIHMQNVYCMFMIYNAYFLHLQLQTTAYAIRNH